MAFRTHQAKPQARIVVEAESHEQLNGILLALGNVVNHYHQQAQTHGQRTREHASAG
jgi:hypothetical protein